MKDLYSKVYWKIEEGTSIPTPGLMRGENYAWTEKKKNANTGSWVMPGTSRNFR